MNLFSSKKQQCDCADLLQQAVAQLRNVNLNTALLSQIVQLLSKSNELSKQILTTETQILEILSKVPVKLGIVWDKPKP